VPPPPKSAPVSDRQTDQADMEADRHTDEPNYCSVCLRRDVEGRK